MRRSLLLSLAVVLGACAPFDGQVWRSQNGYSHAPQLLLTHLRLPGAGRAYVQVQGVGTPSGTVAQLRFGRTLDARGYAACHQIDFLSDGAPVPHAGVEVSVDDLGFQVSEEVATMLEPDAFRALAGGRDVRVRLCNEVHRFSPAQILSLRRFHDATWRGLVVPSVPSSDSEALRIVGRQHTDGEDLRSAENRVRQAIQGMTQFGDAHDVVIGAGAPMLEVSVPGSACYRVIAHPSVDATVPPGYVMRVDTEQPGASASGPFTREDRHGTIRMSDELCLAWGGRISLKLWSELPVRDPVSTGSMSVVLWTQPRSAERIQADAQTRERIETRHWCEHCEDLRRDCERTRSASQCREGWEGCLRHYHVTPEACR